MYKAILIILICFLLFTALVVAGNDEAQEPISNEIEITGFMDFISAYSNSQADKTNLNLGQAELDLTKVLSNSKSVALAIAYNAEESKFELGMATLDLQVSNYTTFSIGQFDVPFGVDYKTYASVDRKLITAPRVVEFTHEGWNDIGAQIYVENKSGNFSAYIVNGFESSAEISEQVFNIATSLFEEQIIEVNTTPSNAIGGRLGINLLSQLEIGSSIALGLNADNKDEMLLTGFDIQLQYQNLSLKGEYISHSLNRSINKEENHGYYLQSLYDFQKFYITSRYGSFQPDGVEWIGQLSIGGGIPLLEGSELRFESILHESSENNRTMIQFVAEF